MLSDGPSSVDSTIDKLDRAILRSLVRDVRASYKSIADSLGVSHNTVRARMDRMIDEKVFKFLLVTNPSKVGLSVTAYLLIKAESADLSTVISALCGRRETMYAGLTLGESDIIALVQFSGPESLYRFVHDFVRMLPGVTDVRTMVVCETVKPLSSHDPRLFEDECDAASLPESGVTVASFRD